MFIKDRFPFNPGSVKDRCPFNPGSVKYRFYCICSDMPAQLTS
jgi:hypothetical protein